MNILVACECSGVVREAFRARCHNVWSCDLKLSNEVIGGPSAIQGGIRFRAAHSSPLAAFRCYDIDHAAGYSGGTGGSIRVELCNEIKLPVGDGLPGAWLSGGRKANDPEFPDPATGRGRFPLIVFDHQVTLMKGQWYWIVISDAAPSPTVDYYSMDYLTGPPNQVPDASIWIRAGAGPWKLVPYLIPSPLVFHYANGLWQGLGYIAAPGGVLQCGFEYGFSKESCGG